MPRASTNQCLCAIGILIRTLASALPVCAFAILALLAFPHDAHAQGSPVYHQPDPSQDGIYLAHLDARGCVERVRESETQWTGRAPTIVWSGACNGGLRDGPGTVKLYQGRQLVAASTGRFADGFRIGMWFWEYPDGRRMQARMPGQGADPLERVVESAKGERMHQVLAGGEYVDDPSGPAEPEPVTANPDAATWADPRGGDTEAVRYAAANFRVGTCAGRARFDAATEFLATRMDVDRFVRRGEAVVRAEAARDMAAWGRASGAIAVRLAALAGTKALEADAVAQELAEMQERLAWGRCHARAGYPYLARMIESLRACERASMLRIAQVRASLNPRVQSVLAECLHAAIHSSRWPTR